MADLSIDAAAARLSTYSGTKIVAEGLMKKAAVAAVLREREGTHGLEVLMIRRAEHPKDPWSGHMALPGGRVDESDADPLAAAIRETREELGLDLVASGRKLGELSHLVAMAHGKPLPMTVVPFVFALHTDPPLVLNHEVQE